MVRKKRMTGIAARMILINLYIASFSKSFFGPTYCTGAGSRWIAYHYADKSPDCQGAIFARHYLSAADPHTGHMVAKVVGSLGPRIHGSTNWLADAGILKGTERALHRSVLISCDAHFIDDRTGLAVSAASSLVFGRRITEQSRILRSQSMC